MFSLRATSGSINKSTVNLAEVAHSTFVRNLRITLGLSNHVSYEIKLIGNIISDSSEQYTLQNVKNIVYFSL